MRPPHAVPQADGDDGGLGGIPRTADDAAAAADRFTPEELAEARRLKQKLEEQAQLAREQLHERVDRDFVFHPPTEAKRAFYESLRDRFRALAHFLIENVPPGRELSTALTKLEESVMHANAGVARSAE